jgi:hypothetical protein
VIPTTVAAVVPTPSTTVGMTDVITVPSPPTPSAVLNASGPLTTCGGSAAGFTLRIKGVLTAFVTLELRPDPAVRATAGSIGIVPVAEEWVEEARPTTWVLASPSRPVTGGASPAAPTGATDAISGEVAPARVTGFADERAPAATGEVVDTGVGLRLDEVTEPVGVMLEGVASA